MYLFIRCPPILQFFLIVRSLAACVLGFRYTDFGRKYIWPGTVLPAVPAVVAASSKGCKGRMSLESVEDVSLMVLRSCPFALSNPAICLISFSPQSDALIHSKRRVCSIP